MMDIDRYRQSTERCARMADAAVSREIRELWLTIQRSYQFLVDREERTGRGDERTSNAHELPIKIPARNTSTPPTTT
jgi:hypothetical protein